jgi:hypothetical protein
MLCVILLNFIKLSVIMLHVISLRVFLFIVMRHHAECPNAECNFTKFHYASVSFFGAMLSVISCM